MKTPELTSAEPVPGSDLAARLDAARGIITDRKAQAPKRILILPDFASPTLVAELIRRSARVRS
jgi:hypothetical protein